MNKKTLLATSIALALGSGNALAAVGDPTDTILIDLNGGGDSYIEAGGLDWAVNSSFADNSVNIGTWEDASGNSYTSGEAAGYIFANPGQTLTCVSDCTFDLYNHASLIGYIDVSGNTIGYPGLTYDYEWTYIFGAKEDISTQSVSMSDTGNDFEFTDASGNVIGTANILAATGNLTFDTAASGNTAAEGFFFEIYYDDNVNSSALTGQGYDDGTKILDSSELTFIDGNFTSTAFYFVDTNGDGAFSLLDASGNPTGDFILTDAQSAWLNMDSFGPNNWNDGIDGGGTGDPTVTPECDTSANAGTDGNCLSVQGTGGTQLEALVNWYDTNYFGTLELYSFISDLVWSTLNDDPFLKTNPSGCFDTDAGSGSADDNCTYVFGSIVNPDGSISGNVVNGSSATSNCFYAGTLPQIEACFAAVTAGEDVLFQTDSNQSFRVQMREVPEPGTIALLGLGLGFLGLGRRRRQRG